MHRSLIFTLSFTLVVISQTSMAQYLANAKILKKVIKQQRKQWWNKQQTILAKYHFLLRQADKYQHKLRLSDSAMIKAAQDSIIQYRISDGVRGIKKGKYVVVGSSQPQLSSFALNYLYGSIGRVKHLKKYRKKELREKSSSTTYRFLDSLLFPPKTLVKATKKEKKYHTNDVVIDDGIVTVHSGSITISPEERKRLQKKIKQELNQVYQKAKTTPIKDLLRWNEAINVSYHHFNDAKQYYYKWQFLGIILYTPELFNKLVAELKGRSFANTQAIKEYLEKRLKKVTSLL